MGSSGPHDDQVAQLRADYVERARGASRRGADGASELAAAHEWFVRAMLAAGWPDLAVDAAHALRAARPGCKATKALVARIDGKAVGTGDLDFGISDSGSGQKVSI